MENTTNKVEISSVLNFLDKEIVALKRALDCPRAKEFDAELAGQLLAYTKTLMLLEIQQRKDTRGY